MLPKPAARVDRALLERLREDFPALSRARLKEWFREGRVFTDGALLDASTPLGPGRHEIELRGLNEDALADEPRARPAPPDFRLAVLHDDARILALDKPSGVPSVPHAPDETRTAVSAALALHPELAEIGRGGLEPAILHRLDTGTSGVLLFARSDEGFDRLRAAWKTPAVRKFYRAVVRRPVGGDPAEPPRPGLIDVPLAHDAKSPKRMRSAPPGTPRGGIRGAPLPARTHVHSCRELRPGIFELEIEIETGVMHQIRCHLAALGWPIVGDPIYRGVPGPRLLLHAERVELRLDVELDLILKSPLPPGWPRRADEAD